MSNCVDGVFPVVFQGGGLAQGYVQAHGFMLCRMWSRTCPVSITEGYPLVHARRSTLVLA